MDRWTRNHRRQISYSGNRSNVVSRSVGGRGGDVSETREHAKDLEVGTGYQKKVALWGIGGIYVGVVDELVQGVAWKVWGVVGGGSALGSKWRG